MKNITTELHKVALTHAIDVRNLSENLLLSLTQEIAMQIEEIPTILANHGLSDEQYNTIVRMPRFIELLRAQMAAWGSASNAAERIRAKSQSMVEMALPRLFEELVKDGLTTPKVELVKTLMKAGSLGVEARDPNGGAERVNIVIQMGDTKDVTVKTAGPVLDYAAEDV